jgi:hypothetical protein
VELLGRASHNSIGVTKMSRSHVDSLALIRFSQFSSMRSVIAIDFKKAK